jgi:aquaporin Z
MAELRATRFGRVWLALSRHWPEYLIEASCLGVFMISACSFGTMGEHPSSPVRQVIVDGFFRRILMGCAMGLTAIGLIFSPWASNRART